MQGHERELDQSELNRVIAPEIKGDALYSLIKHLAATEKLDAVLEIGSSAGGGSTEAFVAGLSENPGHPKLFCIEVSKPRFEQLQKTYASYPFVFCYNRSSVSLDEFPSPETVTKFYKDTPSGLVKFPLEQVLDWLRQDMQYVREAGVQAGAIEAIAAEHGIKTFDMVLIDGSEFTGEVEYDKIRGARIILLDDTNTFKSWNVRQQLLADPMYDLIADDQALRNGYSAFRRRAIRRLAGGPALPIHFFTIVLNGEPFIRYHEHVFARLDVPWHWHVVEGVAALKHDTAWSSATGGHIDSSVHDQGRSNDGTSAYLDDLKARFPDRVTIYRKPLGEFWDGKREMVNAPLPNINEDCLLWQVDNDELWPLEQIKTVHRMFEEQPDRSAAYYWCWYFVGPDKIISTRYNYAQNPNQEWLRTWRYRPGAKWAAHEPPILVTAADGNSVEATDIAKIKPFTQDEMEQAGVMFQHFAYATEDQLLFKEHYYGYRDARTQWRALQQQAGSGHLKDFFGWVSDETMFDDVKYYPLVPVAKVDAGNGAWTFEFGDAGVQSVAPRQQPRIVVDGIFWQYLSSGIGRVWENLLREWTKSGFGENVIVLDRAGTAPRIDGVHYWTIAKHDYARTAEDSLYLDRVCQQLGADLFVSTYYSTPTATASFFSGYDMIPEVLGFPLTDESWKEKQLAIRHAAGHSMISQNSADDLERLYPELPRGSTHVTYVGVAPGFHRADESEVAAFLTAHGLQGKSYVLMVGERTGHGGYKNGELVFRALATMPKEHPLILVCVGGHADIEPQLREIAPKLDVRRLKLNDVELRAAYTGAHALLYPSKYEGFGMPPLETMACGAPAIVCRNSSLPEVVADAAIFVDENDPADMQRAIVSLFVADTRRDFIDRGLRQASEFKFERTARQLADALTKTHRLLLDGELPMPGRGWAEFRKLQRRVQLHGAARGANDRSLTAAELDELRSSRATDGGELVQALQTISAMRRSPFWKAREVTVRMLRKLRWRQRA
ncbi:glycosyltransferase family 4 protein [Tardiphaga sp. 862_B3_N4_1]|uniref:glycosyltransferase family 4 protein n=1 Tax=Tardiphaga sp. 862_B3_N4_1 TaxID=3240764 RepID=UPI003F25F8B6